MAPCMNRRSVWERSTHKGPKHGSMSDPDGGRLRSMAAGGLGRDCVAVMQTTESRQGDNLLSPQRHRHCHSTNGRVFPKSEMRPVLVVQVDNATPIVLNREKSVTPGILGTTALWRSTNPSPGMGAPCSAAASKRTSKLDSWRSRNGCSIWRPAAECAWRRRPQSVVKHC